MNITKKSKGMAISKSFSFWANDLITETLTEETISQLFGLHILKVTVMKSKKRIRNAILPVIASS